LFGGISLVGGQAATAPNSTPPSDAGSSSGGPPSTTSTTSKDHPFAASPAPSTTTTVPRPLGTKVAIVGDSLTEGVRTRLPPLATQYGFDVQIDAQQGRDIEAGLAPLTKLEPNRDLVVVALGTNDARASLTVPVAQARIEHMLSVIGDKTPVLWVNIYRSDTKDASAAAHRFDLALEAEAAVRPNQPHRARLVLVHPGAQEPDGQGRHPPDVGRLRRPGRLVGPSHR
jgi:hypothetical protein